MMNGEETDGGISLGDMEKALVCLLMTFKNTFSCCYFISFW